MTFQFYVIDAQNNRLFGTNNEEKAAEFACVQGYFVIDTRTDRLVFEEGEHMVEDLDCESVPATTALVATLAETYRWSHSEVRGFILEKNGVRLPGLISLDLGDVDGSIKKELHRYATDYHWWDNEAKVLRSGPWTEIDNAQATEALRLAVAALCGIVLWIN